MPWLAALAWIWLAGAETPACSPFGSDPTQSANRLYRALFLRTANDGREYGCHEIDPLLWAGTRHLLASPSHERALETLGLFLSRHGEQQVTEPRRRAFLQRQLWATFEWSASRRDTGARRHALQARLAPVLRRLRLTPDAVRSLPDNYAEAVASGDFAGKYDPENPGRPFLPHDLFAPEGPWVCLGSRILLPTEPKWEREATIHWKQQRYDWGLLEGLLR